MRLSNDRVSGHVPKLCPHTDVHTHKRSHHSSHYAHACVPYRMHALTRRTLTNYSFTCQFIQKLESPLYLGLLVVVFTMPLMVTTLVSLSRHEFAHCHQLVHFTITSQVTASRSVQPCVTTDYSSIPLTDAWLINRTGHTTHPHCSAVAKYNSLTHS